MDREQVLFRLFGKFCPEGTILFTEGSPGDDLYLIQSGAVRLGEARAAGAPGLLGPGDLLGEEAFFGRSTRTARAEIVADSRLIQVNDRTLGAVVRHGPEIARQLVERLLTLVREAQDDLAAWNIGHLLPRFAPDLIEAARGPIDAAELAERSGLVEFDARQVLEELRRRGALVSEGTQYRAPDLGLLQRAIDGILAGGEGT